MANKKLLHLQWMDKTGECYHEENLPTMVAREMLKRAGVHRVKLWTVYGIVEMSRTVVSHAQVSRCTRAVSGKCSNGGEVFITLSSDNEEANGKTIVS